MPLHLRKYVLAGALLACLNITPCYAQTAEVTTQELTLLQDINTSIISDSEGFPYDTLTALSTILLSTDNPLVELATFTGELTAGYAGAKLSNNDGLAIYLALNPLSDTHTVSYGDEYSTELSGNSIAIRLVGFESRFSVDDFGGELIFDGSDFSVNTTLEALTTEFDSDERLYLFTDEGMRIDGEGISVTGVLEIEGTNADDTFDFTALYGSRNYALVLDGMEGTDTIKGPSHNDVPIRWEIRDDHLGSLLIGEREIVHFTHIEAYHAGVGRDTFYLTGDTPFSGSIDGGGSSSDILVGSPSSTWTIDSLDCIPNNSSTVSLSSNDSLYNSSEFQPDCAEPAYITSNFTPITNASISGSSSTVLIGESSFIALELEEDPQQLSDSNAQKSGGGSFGLFGLITFLLCLTRKNPSFRQPRLLKLLTNKLRQ